MQSQQIMPTGIMSSLEAQFVSMDGTAMEGETVDFGAPARRSISIFSRRGVEDMPERRVPFVAPITLATSRRADVPKQTTERQRKWAQRRSVPVHSSSPKKIRGTVLNAVPAAQAKPLAPLEEEKTASPKDGLDSATPLPAKTASSSPQEQRSPIFGGRRDSPVAQRPKTAKRKSMDSRIGTWINGTVHWDATTKTERSIDIDERDLSDTGLHPVSPMPIRTPAELNAAQTSRPQLSVVIPGSRPASNDTKVPKPTEQPAIPSRPVAVSVAPANHVSRFSSAGLTTTDDQCLVSPLEAPISQQPVQIIVEDVHGTKENVTRQSRASSSESSVIEQDDASIYSRRSSATSVEAETAVQITMKTARRRGAGKTGSKAFSIISPAAAGVFDYPAVIRPINKDKPLPPRPTATTPPSSPLPKREEFSSRQRATSVRSEPDLRTDEPKHSWVESGLSPIHQEDSRTSSYLLSRSAPGSPRLSQAVEALESSLSLLTKAAKDAEPHSAQGSVQQSKNVHDVVSPPTLPKRSRKRDWQLTRPDAVQLQRPTLPPRRKTEGDLKKPVNPEDEQSAAFRMLRKRPSSLAFHRLHNKTLLSHAFTQQVSDLPQVVYEDGLIVFEGPTILRKEEMDDATPASAEDVLIHILEALTSVGDLLNTASINKGMYRVYQENDLHLIRTVTKNQSPAAWEFREWCPPEPSSIVSKVLLSPVTASSPFEHTAKTYMQNHKKDVAAIDALKLLVLKHCETIVRRETALALAMSTHRHTQRFEDAFWRIWCFCKIFGSGKGREDDITGQLDWLKGGVLANNSDLSATMNMNLDFEASSVLINPPEHFARGNDGGLSAEQLYDMTEIWGCLTALLQPYQGKIDLARAAGVFLTCEVFDGDEEREEYLLEEWIAHLLTLGPAVILDMAGLATLDPAAGFGLARTNGWTNWTPAQYAGSRTAFLKEPVARLYEERVAAAVKNPAEIERKERSRQRVATLAAEIRLARQSSTYQRLPLIDQAHEKAMSVVSRHNSAASSIVSSLRSPAPRPNAVSQQRVFPARAWAPHFSTPRPREPVSLVLSQHRRKISPIIEDRVLSFSRVSVNLESFQARVSSAGAADDTSGRAIQRIVEMGFTRTQAKEALNTTDMGDGLSIDRAVEHLLMSAPF